jgi:hypothetical protein
VLTTWADAALVITQGGVYCGIVKFRWPLVITYSALFTVFFHYEIRYTHSIWIEFVGGLIIYVACNAAYRLTVMRAKRSKWRVIFISGSKSRSSVRIGKVRRSAQNPSMSAIAC